MLRQSRLLSYVSPAIIVHSAIAAKSSCHSELAAKSVETGSKRDFMPLPGDSESINVDRNNLRRIDRTDQSSRNAAFTLAEVLITLGIIGIIAAMTLPTLIQRKQEKVTVTRLKKAYSILSQTYDRMVYELGSEPRDWGMGGMYEEETHIILANKFLPYLNVIQNCIGKDKDFVTKHCIDNVKYADPKNYASVRLIDGMTLIFRNWTSTCNYNFGNEKHLQNVCGSLIVDINGPGSPNLNGNDIFVFYLTNYGIYPVGTQFDTAIPFNKYCDKDTEWGKIVGSFNNGAGCTAWVLYNENQEYLRCSDLDWNGKKKCR